MTLADFARAVRNWFSAPDAKPEPRRQDEDRSNLADLARLLNDNEPPRGQAN